MNRQEVIDFIENEFDVRPEYLWESFPDYAVFRNRKNKKWFALVAGIEKRKLGLDGNERISVLNVKCDPILIGSLLHNEGFLPAYHMSKKSWITIRLDGSAPDEQIKDLIRLSYELISKKGR